ncbi:hypothetical protein Hanom_Chr08g00758171 [Helianthus anomalus]
MYTIFFISGSVLTNRFSVNCFFPRFQLLCASILTGDMRRGQCRRGTQRF